MKNFKMKTFSILFALLLLSSCVDKRSCEGFPQQLTEYFPYHEGDILKFIHTKYQDTMIFQDTLVFRISEANATKPYELSVKSDCDCESSFAFKTNRYETNYHNMQISGTIKYVKKPLTCIEINCCIDRTDGKTLSYFTFHYDDPQLSLFSKDTIFMKGISYLEVAPIQNMCIVKHKGIVSFDDFTDCTWRRIDL